MNQGVFISGNPAELEQKLKKAGIKAFKSIVTVDRYETTKELPTLEDGTVSPVFFANGNRYSVIDPEELSIERYGELQARLSYEQSGVSSRSNCLDFWNSATEEIMVARDEGAVKTALGKALFEFKVKAVQFDESRWLRILRAASLFVLREGDENKEWSIELADSYIEDWKKERFNAKSFLVLVLKYAEDFIDCFEEGYQRLGGQEQKEFNEPASIDDVLKEK